MLSWLHPRGLAAPAHAQPDLLLVLGSQAVAVQKKSSPFLAKPLPRFRGKRIATGAAFSDTQDIQNPFSHILDNWVLSHHIYAWNESVRNDIGGVLAATAVYGSPQLTLRCLHL